MEIGKWFFILHLEYNLAMKNKTSANRRCAQWKALTRRVRRVKKLRGVIESSSAPIRA